jgi:hypothetical protein
MRKAEIIRGKKFTVRVDVGSFADELRLVKVNESYEFKRIQLDGRKSSCSSVVHFSRD